MSILDKIIGTHSQRELRRINPTVDAIEDFIPWAQTHGYTFIPLTENSIGAHHSVQN